MYSIVLMSAIATSGDTASFGWRSGCYGGSCSGIVAGCSGYSACYGGCGGCGGRSLFPLFPGLRARLSARFHCHGGYVAPASCYGSSCYGSSCFGSTVVTPAADACGGCPPTGGGYAAGAGYAGSFPAYTLGYGFAGLPTFPQGYSMGGCYGTGVVGPYYYGAGFNDPPLSLFGPGAPGVPPMDPPAPLGPDLTRRTTTAEYAAASATPTAATPARLTVELPADAVLFVDGEKVTGTGTTRHFHTPNLPAGTFFYDLKAEVKVDGETVTEELRVLVKAGDAKTESFGKLLAAVKAGKPALVSK